MNANQAKANADKKNLFEEVVKVKMLISRASDLGHYEVVYVPSLNNELLEQLFFRLHTDGFRVITRDRNEGQSVHTVKWDILVSTPCNK